VNTSADSSEQPRRRRWWDHPEDLADEELLLVVRSMVAVDRAVDARKKAA
jgi:hypothetical protein